MKMFVVLALVAAAVAEPEAEADAQLLYGARTYSPYVASSFVRTVAAPVSTYANTYAPLVRSYQSYTPYNYAHHYIAKREAEAEADPALFYGSYASPVTTYATNTYPPYVASPVVRTVAAPVVQTVASPFVRALTSHQVTSYNSPDHYTAVSNGVFGPKYIAKNGAVQHVVKREAEAEADPALLYNAAPAYPSAYAAAPLTTTYNHVATPLTTTYNVAAPVVANTYNHAVAATTKGLVHSSHVGVCVNTYGQQVEC